MMDGLLFNPEDYTDENVRTIMQGHTCRQCAYRSTVRQGNCGMGNPARKVSVCEAHKSGRTKSGLLRVRVDQPACIMFTSKDNAK